VQQVLRERHANHQVQHYEAGPSLRYLLQCADTWHSLTVELIREGAALSSRMTDKNQLRWPQHANVNIIIIIV